MKLCLTKNNSRPIQFHNSSYVSFLFSKSSLNQNSSVGSDATKNLPVSERATLTSQPVIKTARAKTCSQPSMENENFRSSSDKCHQLDYKLWHMRLGHAGRDHMNLYAKKHNVKWTDIPSDALFCLSCVAAKARRLSFTTRILRCKWPLQLIHADLFGLVKIPSA
jgi:GAG-pre-integrase domain